MKTLQQAETSLSTNVTDSDTFILSFLKMRLNITSDEKTEMTEVIVITRSSIKSLFTYMNKKLSGRKKPLGSGNIDTKYHPNF